MNKPDTLVVTATLGYRDTLIRTIDSVHKIGGSRVKHIIIAPNEACTELKKKFITHEIIVEPPNCKGIYPALNFVLKLYAKDFKYLTYINDDDYWLPNYIKLFKTLDDQPEIEIAYGRANYVDDKGTTITEQTSTGRYKAFLELLHSKIVLFTQQATLIRSDLFIKLGGFDESFKLVADTKFWLKAIESNAKLKYINIICAAYTIQKDQLSSNKSLQEEEHKRLLASTRKINKINIAAEAMLFRLLNIKIYFKRFSI